MDWRRAARKARHSQIERAPEQMDRTDLAEKAGAKRGQHPIRLHQRLPEAVHGVGIVARIRCVALERRRDLDLDWARENIDLDGELAQAVYKLSVKRGHRHGA
ncbi:MAG: hypothetical protein R3E72_09330 [Steroidobacteraceae bacterium]